MTRHQRWLGLRRVEALVADGYSVVAADFAADLATLMSLFSSYMMEHQRTNQNMHKTLRRHKDKHKPLSTQTNLYTLQIRHKDIKNGKLRNMHKPLSRQTNPYTYVRSQEVRHFLVSFIQCGKTYFMNIQSVREMPKTLDFDVNSFGNSPHYPGSRS